VALFLSFSIDSTFANNELLTITTSTIHKLNPFMAIAGFFRWYNSTEGKLALLLKIEKYLKIKVASRGSHHELTFFAISKDEWDTKEGSGKSMHEEMHCTYCGMHLSH